MNRKIFQFASLVLWFLSLAVGIVAESALACNVPPAPMNPPPPVRIRFKTPTTVQLRIGSYATFGVRPGQFCACGLRTAGLGTITAVTRARIFSAGTNTPVSGFSFAPNDTTTGSFNGLQPGNWQAFFTPIDTPVAPGIATDIVLDVTVVAGSTFADVAADLAAGTIGTAEANADGTVMNDMDLNLVTPGDLSQWNFTYVADNGSGDAAFYWLDATNGPLLPQGNFPLQGRPDGLAYIPGPPGSNSDWIIWALSPSSTLEVDRMDQDTGALTPNGPPVPSGGLDCDDLAAIGFDGTGTGAVKLHEYHGFVYALHATSNNLVVHQFNQSSGALTLIQSVPTVPAPQKVATFTVAGQRYVATANCGNPCPGGPGSVSVFAANAMTGLLTEVQGSPFLTGGRGTVWVETNSTGTLGITANAGSSDISVFPIDQTTGAWPLLGTFSAGGMGTSSVAADPSDQYVIATNLFSGSGTISTINLNNTLTLTGTFPTGMGPFSIKFGPTSPTGSFFYVPNLMSGNVSGFNFNNVTGTATPLPGSPYPAFSGPYKAFIVGFR